MKKHIEFIPVLCTLTILLVVGCGKIGSSPKAVLSKYLDASLHGRHEEAYQYISAKDKAIKSLHEYLSDQQKEESPFAQVLASKVSYEIKEVTIDGNQAKANVDVTIPDFGVIFKDILGAAFMSAFGEKKDKKEIEKMLTEEYKGKDIPMTTTTQFFELVKEVDGWKVFFDWKTKKKVDAAMSQAKQLEKEKKLYAAKEKYQEVLELDSEVVEASEKIKELDEKIKSFKEKQAYVDNVKIRNLEVAKALLGGLGVFGEVKNLGDRTLTEVEITIYFLDKNGNPIFEKTYYPVLVSKWSFGDRAQPLKPGYIRKFGVKADNAPSEWAKKVRVKVTDIKFEK
ncbi:MAG: hypothetical protein JRI46_00145 [Deltaproteobacteria bacterium]|nr:hypothetical protein [Deltaproteobacteria bacterium]